MTKISSLTSLTGAGVTGADDLLAIVDMSETGTARNKKITVDELKVALGIGSGGTPTESIMVACSDETTAIDSTGTKVTFRMPYGFTLSAVRASLTGASATGTFTVDINEGGSSILSTKLTIDATEKTSATAATAAVISDTGLADDAEITIDVDDIGDGTATGLKVTLIGTKA